MDNFSNTEKNENKINWINWRNEGHEFKTFTEKETQSWIQKGFCLEEAREWLKTYIQSSSHAYFLSKEKKITSHQFSNLSWKEKDQLNRIYNEWLKQFVVCSHCQKRVLENEIYFQKEIKKGKKVNYCSSSCQSLSVIYAQEWLDRNYPKNGASLRKNERRDIDNYGKTRSQITHLELRDQELTGFLDLSDFINLEELCCPNNQLIGLNLDSNLKLEKLYIGNNNFSGNLDWLSHLVNLKAIYLTGNNFSGSSDFVKNMSKLEIFHLKDPKSDFNINLEHFPLSLKEADFDLETTEELNMYNYDIILWNLTHPHLSRYNSEEINRLFDHSQYEPIKLITIPEPLKEELNNFENYLISYDFDHSKLSKLFFCDNFPFFWNYKASEFPLRLYDLANEKVLFPKKDENISNYLILSYCWGTDWEKTPQSYGQPYATDLTKLGRKALNKVQATWEFLKKNHHLDVNHIWIDNFCINQADPREKGQEVAKQQIYYSNASATLIAIDAKIGDIDKKKDYQIAKICLEKIIQSPWFRRSWTFQEGLLSKKTIFMFDDALVDGRVLALAWGSLQRENFLSISHPSCALLITPLGWSYGAQSHHSANLNLSEALLAVRHRQQTVPIDGIYSILGLLPYGSKVKVKYQPFGHRYSQEELKEAISDVTKEAYLYDFKQVIDYSGPRNINDWYSPTVNVDGSTNIEEFMIDNSNWSKLMLSKIGKMSKKGIQILQGHVIENNDNKKVIEISRKKDDNSFYNETIKLTISNLDKLFSIKKDKSTHNYEEEPQEIFVDVINREVILKSEQPELYRQLILENSLTNQIEQLTFSNI